jgi:hypothetical protein
VHVHTFGLRGLRASPPARPGSSPARLAWLSGTSAGDRRVASLDAPLDERVGVDARFVTAEASARGPNG